MFLATADLIPGARRGMLTVRFHGRALRRARQAGMLGGQDGSIGREPDVANCHEGQKKPPMIGRGGSRTLVLAVMTGLLLVLLAGLPLLHGLHHDLSEAPRDCPVRLLQQALLLLFVVVVLLVRRLLLGLVPRLRLPAPASAPALSFPGFTPSSRSPPLS